MMWNAWLVFPEPVAPIIKTWRRRSRGVNQKLVTLASALSFSTSDLAQSDLLRALSSQFGPVSSGLGILELLDELQLRVVLLLVDLTTHVECFDTPRGYL